MSELPHYLRINVQYVEHISIHRSQANILFLYYSFLANTAETISDKNIVTCTNLITKWLIMLLFLLLNDIEGLINIFTTYCTCDNIYFIKT